MSASLRRGRRTAPPNAGPSIWAVRPALRSSFVKRHNPSGKARIVRERHSRTDAGASRVPPRRLVDEEQNPAGVTPPHRKRADNAVGRPVHLRRAPHGPALPTRRTSTTERTAPPCRATPLNPAHPPPPGA